MTPPSMIQCWLIPYPTVSLDSLAKTLEHKECQITTHSPFELEDIDFTSLSPNDCPDIMFIDGGSEVSHSRRMCRHLRDNGYKGFLLLASQDSTTQGRVKSLKAGADDLCVKPYSSHSIREKVLEYIDLEKKNQSAKKYSFDDLMLDTKEGVLHSKGGKQIKLTQIESKLMKTFLKQSQKLCSKEWLTAEVWKIHFDTKTNFLSVSISGLRKKISKISKKPYIHTVRGKGYKLDIDP